jgi:hypothetical protein
MGPERPLSVCQFTLHNISEEWRSLSGRSVTTLVLQVCDLHHEFILTYARRLGRYRGSPKRLCSSASHPGRHSCIDSAARKSNVSEAKHVLKFSSTKMSNVPCLLLSCACKPSVVFLKFLRGSAMWRGPGCDPGWFHLHISERQLQIDRDVDWR